MWNDGMIVKTTYVSPRALGPDQQLKRDVYLKNASNVPTIIEYMDRRRALARLLPSIMQLKLLKMGFAN